MNAPTALIAEDEPLLAEGLRQELMSLWPELQVLPIAGDGVHSFTSAIAIIFHAWPRARSSIAVASWSRRLESSRVGCSRCRSRTSWRRSG